MYHFAVGVLLFPLILSLSSHICIVVLIFWCFLFLLHVFTLPVNDFPIYLIFLCSLLCVCDTFIVKSVFVLDFFGYYSVFTISWTIFFERQLCLSSNGAFFCIPQLSFCITYFLFVCVFFCLVKCV